MKKLFAVILSVSMILMCSACGKPKINRYDANISELRDVVMTAENEAFFIELVSGEREDPFAVDGIAGGRIDFTVVTLSPKKDVRSAAYGYELYLGDKKFEGQFNRHPFKPTYSFEISEKAMTPAAITVTGPGEQVQNFELVSAFMPDMISAEAALETGLIRFKDKVKALENGDGLAAEIFVRFIKNDVTSSGGYYWYVAVVPAPLEVYAVLIDPVTREVVAVRD